MVGRNNEQQFFLCQIGDEEKIAKLIEFHRGFLRLRLSLGATLAMHAVH
jgi:hypothetical protein